MNRRFWLGLAAVCACTALMNWNVPARVVQAQAMTEAHYTYVAEWAVPRDKWPAMDANSKESEAVLKELQADGTIVGWGWYSRLAHDESGFTHGDWFQATSIAGLVRALDALAKTAGAPVLASAKHQDYVLRSLAHHYKPGVSGRGVLWVADYSLKADHAAEFTGLVQKEFVPLLEKLLADGTITGYEVDTAVVHSFDPSIINIAYIAPDGSGVDKVQAAVRAAAAANPQVEATLNASTNPQAHRDLIARVAAYAHK